MRSRLINVIVFAWILTSASPGAEEEITVEDKKTCMVLYEEFESKLKDANEILRQSRMDRLPIDVRIIRESGEPLTYEVNRGRVISLHFWKDNDKQIRFRRLFCPSSYKRHVANLANHRHASPPFTFTHAISQARDYLDAFEISIPPGDFELSTAELNGRFKNCWEVGWTRVAGAYPWDDFSEGWREGVSVVFREDTGLVLLGNDIFSPAPQSTAVAIKREDAISKAANQVPLVQQTPFYQRAHLEGFAISSLASCALEVAVPNWLLDPDRAVWTRETPPDETRLCWVVEFATRDAREAQRGIKGKLIPPNILIYLDAKTGEVVGANFT